MTETKLKINDNIYRYCFPHGLMLYVIKEIRQSENCLMYVVECQNCRHEFNREKCLVLLSETEPGRFNFVDMINEPEESYLHINYYASEGYFSDKLRAKRAYLSDTLNSYEEDLKRAEKNVENLKQKIFNLKLSLEL